MNLLDAADVRTGPESGWQLGSEEFVRECGVFLELMDACDDDTQNILVDGNGPDVYTTRPLMLVGTLSQPAKCARDDDASWLDSAVRHSLDMAVARALVTAPGAGIGAEAIWIGLAEVSTVPFTGATLTGGGPAALAVAIAAARTKWYQTVLTADDTLPILHISPENAPSLSLTGLLHMKDGEARTVWGNKVVMSPGYDIGGAPVAFWTGPIKITVSTVESTGPVRMASSNRVTVSSSMLALIDLPPCSIVRVDFA